MLLKYFYDDMEFNLDVGDMEFKDFRVYDLSGKMTTQRSRKIQLEDFKFTFA